MANFCNKCGAPSDGGPFCGTCGAAMAKPAAPVQPQPVSQALPPVQPAAMQSPAAMPPNPAPVAAAAQKGSPLLKIVIGLVAVFFIGAVLVIGGVYYVVYRVKEKVQEVKTQVLGETSSNSNSSSNSASNPSSTSNPNSGGPSGSSSSAANNDTCRLLSKEEVSKSIGIEIASTESGDKGCMYFAVGTSADMAAKHTTAMAKSRGAGDVPPEMQGMIGGFFKAVQADNPKDALDKDGKVPVLSFSIDTNSADTQMALNEKVLGALGPKDAPIEGIGDHAFNAAGSMMMVRKGDKLVRIMYMLCPCGVEQIKPLAKKLADRL